MNCKFCNSKNVLLTNLVSCDKLQGIVYHCLAYCSNCKKSYHTKRQDCANIKVWKESKTVKRMKQERSQEKLL